MGGKYSYSSISRRETGGLKIDFDYLQDFCKALNLSPDEAEQVMASARVNLLRPDRKLSEAAAEYSRIVLNSKMYESYSCGIIGRYLYTFSYAREVFKAHSTNPSDTDIEKLARSRVEDAPRTLKDSSRTFRLLLHENSLYFTIGSQQVMLEQLESLLRFQDEPNVEFRILPKETCVNVPITQSFYVIDNTYCYCENRIDYSITDDPAMTSRFCKDFDTLWANAVIGVRRNQIIERAMEHYRSLGGNGKHDPRKGYSRPPQAPAHV